MRRLRNTALIVLGTVPALLLFAAVGVLSGVVAAGQMLRETWSRP
ncbi:exported hypothetical protein [Thiomonas sp. CB3]|nr:exported hypothetical protein [Thiomonas sp. CB3]